MCIILRFIPIARMKIMEEGKYKSCVNYKGVQMLVMEVDDLEKATHLLNAIICSVKILEWWRDYYNVIGH